MLFFKELDSYILPGLKKYFNHKLIRYLYEAFNGTEFEKPEKIKIFKKIEIEKFKFYFVWFGL